MALAIAYPTSHNHPEMSGIFDLPSLRFLRRFRFFELMMRTFASSLFRWLIAPAYGLRQVHFRLDEAEFSAASQSTCKLFERTLTDSRAADCVPNIFGALRPLNNWVKLKDHYELLFIRETTAPFARRTPQQRQLRTLPGSAERNETRKKDILAAGCRFFWKRPGNKENSGASAQWRAAFSPGTKT